MIADFEGMVNAMEKHQNMCGTLVFTNNEHTEIKCSKCGLKIYKGKHNLLAETEDCLIEFL